MSTAAIVLAGGSSTRLPRSENKVYLEVGNRPLMAWSLRAFESSPLIDSIVLVIRAGDEPHAEQVISSLRLEKLTRVVIGGATRHSSEHAGLEVLASEIEGGSIDLVCIHDAARPFVRQELLRRVLTTAARVGGAVPGLPLDSEFLLEVRATGAPEYLSTHGLRRVQTPQAFRAGPLLRAHRQATSAGAHGADTAESVEFAGELDVEMVPGDHANIKVTFVEDLHGATAIAATWPE